MSATDMRAETEGKRVALLLSGGVDSAVALHVMVSNGIRPDCFYIKIAPQGINSQGDNSTGDDQEWDCTSEEDLEMATAVARKYGCRLEVVDCEQEYYDRVTAYTMEKVRQGLTPNPDVMCNRMIKFGAFDEKRGHDYDIIATGHYATTEKDSDGRKWLCTSPDAVKDQTDFLAQIYDWQLKKALFPIGTMTKEEVRRIAEEEHLVNARRKDSQGICFLGKIDYNEYVRRFLGEKPGDVIELETGRRIGQHRGLWFHTIGQRHGLGFGGGPWFVVKKDMTENILYVSHGYDPETAYASVFGVRDFHWLTPEGMGFMVQDSSGLNITFKIRHTPEFHQARIEWKGADEMVVRSEKAIHGVAPGQFCVIYDADHHRCYGSGEITL